MAKKENTFKSFFFRNFSFLTRYQNVSCVEAINDHVLLCIRVQINDMLVDSTADSRLTVTHLILTCVLHLDDLVSMILHVLEDRQEFIVEEIELLGGV